LSLLTLIVHFTYLLKLQIKIYLVAGLA